MLHPSTLCALEAMQSVQGDILRILDVGCGSGLLTLAAKERWPHAQVVASDISATAMRDCEFNIYKNNKNHNVKFVRSEGFSHPDILLGAPYDLILCNLLAELHFQYMYPLYEALAPGGRAILSGILHWRLAQVEEALAILPLEINCKINHELWHCLTVTKLS